MAVRRQGVEQGMQIEIRFSFVVPVYNVKEYLDECMESLLNQTYKAYEIILVDDGSTDGSGELCDKYAEMFPIVKAFHKINGGVSDARNYGIEKVLGEYFVFVDSDDYIDKDTLKIYYKACLDNNYPDVLIDQANYEFCDSESNSITKSNDYYDCSKFGRRSGKEAFMALSEGSPLWSPCAKCYKMEYWRENDFKFTKGLYAEDLDLTYKVIYLADSVAMTPILYYYRSKRAGSISNTLNKKKFMDVFKIIDGWEQFFDKYQVENRASDNMRFYFGEIIIFLIMGNLYLLAKEERGEICEKLKEYRYVCSRYNNLLGRAANISIKIIGIKGTGFILHYMKRMCLNFMKKR